MLSEEALKLLVPFISAVLVAFITFLLTRGHYEKKRKDDLEDRDFNRRVAVCDMRIQEAREYVDTWKSLILSITAINHIFTDSPHVIEENMKGFYKRFASLPSSVDEAIKKKASIDILYDSELENLHTELSLMMYPRLKTVIEVFDKLRIQQTHDMKDVNIEILDVPYRADEIITKMKARLDELAKTVK